MLPDKAVKCPYTGFRRSCHSIVTKHTCPKWVHISGKDPQSSIVFEKFGCADSFVPLLLIENSQQQRQTGKAIESFSNEIVLTGNRLVSIADSVPKQVKVITSRKAGRGRKNAAG